MITSWDLTSISVPKASTNLLATFIVFDHCFDWSTAPASPFFSINYIYLFIYLYVGEDAICFSQVVRLVEQVWHALTSTVDLIWVRRNLPIDSLQESSGEFVDRLHLFLLFIPVNKVRKFDKWLEINKIRIIKKYVHDTFEIQINCVA